ncbi:MAG: hypothetical protein G3M70_03400 [Candidatus Nitronauta litoralis]|uniref:Uncharacterized protein n=1 Tax=Candidatus Nitronauta litoralis TaxID=2705533 RepID=A0A7T0BTY9_9BACT|nr:MAG: hypothetical protein G3M70_03400 [Candidatus Nitronauta litoralis]
MSESGDIKGFLKAVVWLNLATLLVVFLGPRLWFMISHRGMTQSEYSRTAGTYDLPNIYRQSFELAEAIRLATPKDANIFLPEAGGPALEPSALLRTLLPRHLFFERTAEYQRFHGAAPLLSRSWRVVKADQKKSCRKKGREQLADTGYWLCRIDR